jgi:hypothetical protein
VTYGHKHGEFETGELKEGKKHSIDDPLIPLLTPYDEIPEPFLRFLCLLSFIQSLCFQFARWIISRLPRLIRVIRALVCFVKLF